MSARLSTATADSAGVLGSGQNINFGASAVFRMRSLPRSMKTTQTSGPDGKLMSC